MSLCRLSCPYVGVLDVVVTSFSSPLTGDMRGSQTKYSKHYYPIKASQQSLTINGTMRSWDEYRRFQEFVRSHHIRALSTVQQPEITIYWPERGIDNWSGVVKKLRAGDERFNTAPKVQVEFLLIDSLLSQKTFTSSFGEGYKKFFETDIGDPSNVPVKLPSAGNGTGGSPRPGDPGYIGPVSPVTPKNPLSPIYDNLFGGPRK